MALRQVWKNRGGDLMINEVVTLSEIEEWVCKKNKDMPLPVNWRELLHNYILSKERFADIHRERLRFVEECMEKAKDDWFLLTGEEYDSE